jgi:hypothetical protein
MIQLKHQGITPENTYVFNITDNNKILGELNIDDYEDYYVIQIEANDDFYTYDNNHSTNQKVNQVFIELDNWIQNNNLFDKPYLLAEDERVANYYAVTHNLIRVPRWYGWYF